MHTNILTLFAFLLSILSSCEVLAQGSSSSSSSTSSSTSSSLSSLMSLPVSDCSCTSTNITCTDNIAELCGGALACAVQNTDTTGTDFSPCTIYMSNDDCGLIGIASSTAVVADISDLNCSDYISATASDPSIDYMQAEACCILEHEVSHVAATECPSLSNVLCGEVPAFSQSLSCIQEVGIAVCAAFPDSAECRQACGTAAAVAASITSHTCACNIGNYPSADISSCKAECKSETSPDELPYNCPSIIDVDFVGITTSGTHSDVIDAICEGQFPTVTPTAEPTPPAEETGEPAPPPASPTGTATITPTSTNTPSATTTPLPSPSIMPQPTAVPTSTPTSPPTVIPTVPTAMPSGTVTGVPTIPPASPTGTATILPIVPPILIIIPTAAPTSTQTPTRTSTPTLPSNPNLYSAPNTNSNTVSDHRSPSLL